MNDLQLLLENQQARNEDLEKKQRKFDTELSSFKADATREKDDRERIQKEKDRQQTEMIEKEAELRVCSCICTYVHFLNGTYSHNETQCT